MRAELVAIHDHAAWAALHAASGPTVLQQGWAYGAALAAKGLPVRRLALVEGGEPIGSVQLIGRGVLGGPPVVWHGLGGPVWREPSSPGQGVAVVRLLRRRFGWRRGALVLLTPGGPDAGPLPGAGLRRAMTGYHTARLDLRAGSVRLHAGLDADWRRLLRRGPAPGLDLAWQDPRCDPLSLDDALAREAEVRARRRYRGLPSGLVAAVARRSAGLLATATAGGTVVAQALLLAHGRTATYVLGWTSAEGRRLHAHHHLVWGAIVRLATSGIAWLDLGGLDLPQGIVRFKLASGAVPVTFAGTFA